MITIGPEIAVQLFRLRIAGGNEGRDADGGGGIFVPGSSSLVVTDSEVVEQPRRERRRDLERRAADARQDDRRRQRRRRRRRDARAWRRGRPRGTSAPATFTNTTFSGNDAGGLGGGIFTRALDDARRTSRSSATIAPPRGAGHRQRRRALSAVRRARDLTTADEHAPGANVNGGCGGTAGLPDRLQQRAPGRAGCQAPPATHRRSRSTTCSSPDAMVGAARRQRRPDADARLLDDSPAIDAGRGLPRRRPARLPAAVRRTVRHRRATSSARRT